jgi:AraC-like DNA-binding protein
MWMDAERTGMRADPLTSHLAQALARQTSLIRGNPVAPRAELQGWEVLKLFERVRDATGDAFMGLAASRCPPAALPLFSDIAVRCATLREAIELPFAFLGLVCGAARFKLVENGSTASVEITIESDGKDPDHILTQWHMITWHKLSQWLIGAEILLDRIEFSHPMQVGYSAYAKMFGSNCLFRCPVNRLSFSASYLDRRVVRTPADLEQLFKRVLGNFTEPTTLSRTWKQLAKRALQMDIVGDEKLSTIDRLADEFGVSGQTLRRRLKAEGTSYRLLKAEVRREAALDALSDNGATLSEASLKAGFAEPNGLTRALRSSKDLSPRKLREQVRLWQDALPH